MSISKLSHHQQHFLSRRQLATILDLSRLESPDTGLLRHHRSSTCFAPSESAAIIRQFDCPLTLPGVVNVNPTSKNLSISHRSKGISVELHRPPSLYSPPDVDEASPEKINFKTFTGLTPDEEVSSKLPVSQRRRGEPSLPRAACSPSLSATASVEFYQSFPPISSAAAEETRELGRTLNLLSGLKPMKSYGLFYWTGSLGRVGVLRLVFLLGCESIMVKLSLYHFRYGIFSVQRHSHHAFRQAFALQPASKRDLIGLLYAVSFWSTFGKCETSLVKHLDPIVEDVVLGDHHRFSMSSEVLSFPALLSVFINPVALDLPFEDLEVFTPYGCMKT